MSKITNFQEKNNSQPINVEVCYWIVFSKTNIIFYRKNKNKT